MFYPHTGRIPEGYRKDTGRRQVTRQASLGIHSESTRHVLVNSGNMSGKQPHCALHVRVLAGGRVPFLPLAEAGLWRSAPPIPAPSSPGHTVNGGGSKDFLPKCIKAPAYRKDTGRIPEGHRKGAKSPFKWHSEQSCKKTCIPEGYRKDTGRESHMSENRYGVTFIKSYIYIYKII